MMARMWKNVAAGVVLATVVASLPSASEAKKAGKRRTVSATIEGKHVKWGGRLLSFTQNDSGFSIIGTKAGATKTIGVGCPVILSAQTYPVTVDTYCSGQYAEHGGKRYWFNTGGPTSAPFQVTFDAFDGTVVEGRFSGSLTPVVGATSAVTVEGSFRGALNGR